MATPLSINLVDNPSLWRLSLMISAEGVDVVARRTVGEDSYISSHIDIPAASSNISTAIEEIIYSNPMLLQPFGKVDIVINGGFTLVVPEDADEDVIEELFKPEEPEAQLSAPLDSRNKLIFRIDRGLYNFLKRTYDTAEPTHALSVLNNYFSYRSRVGNSGKMYVDLSRVAMNVLVYNRYGLAMVSGFKCERINDAAYYALASADISGFDFGSDEMRIVGNAERRGELMAILRKFARHVLPVVLPTAVYTGDNVAKDAPFPLMILPLCE